MLGTRLNITVYERQHRSALLDLACRSRWVHKHLDWHETSQWLDGGMGLVLLAWNNDKLEGYIGLSKPIAGWSWIRLLGIRDGTMPGMVVRELCEAAEFRCAEQGISNIVILMITNWLPAYFHERGFSNEEDLITMAHIGLHLPPAPAISARIRRALDRDVAAMAAIDRLAFEAPWQLADYDMRQAFRMATSATVATFDDEVIAYQLSTRQEEIGHLARLAVHPAHRRKQIASALLHQMLTESKRCNLTELSVNTQLGNWQSQRLYERYGFFRNGYDIELWRKQIR